VIGAFSGVFATMSATGAALKGAGFYTLTHATSNLTMLASTAGGASGAGTVGIMGGTGGVIGGTAAIVMAPATILAGGLLSAGLVSLEGGCYLLADDPEAISDYDAVLVELRSLAQRSSLTEFSLLENHRFQGDAIIFVKKSDGTAVSYSVTDLYISDGIVIHRRMLGDEPIIDMRFTLPMFL